MTITVVGLVYLALGFALWVHAWTQGATTHTLCGCGDPALFLWFFQWPATALAHGQNPFFSTALFHPTGVNLLAQTSVTGLSLPLVPVTWLWGPVSALNVASTITPALTAFTAFIAFRRWVHWTPAAFVGGLLYGFSPFVLTSLEFAHLMTAALMVLPLILIALDEILIRQRHSAVWSGVLLGLLVFVQFFFSTELLAITALMVLVGIVALVLVGLIFDRAALAGVAPHAANGLVVGLAVGGVLLAWPVWFALAGPAHLSGLVWPNVNVLGGYIPSSFVAPGFPDAHSGFLPLSGYDGAFLPSGTYFGWGFLAVLAGGTAAFWRDRRLWFFGFVLVVCGVCSLGIRRGQWEPARLFDHVPVLENVIQQRFMAIGFLVAAVMLALILEHVYALVPDWRGAGGALLLSAVSLVPMGVMFGERLPFTMRPVILPRWYTTVAPALPPGRVLLSYPAPFSGIQSAMAWQAVNRMHYSQAGGGGPQGVARRAGSAERGLQGVGPPRLRGGGGAALGEPGRAGGGAPRAGRLAGDHRGHRHQSCRPSRAAGERSGLRRRVHDGGAGPAPGAAGRRLGLERGAVRAAASAAAQVRRPVALRSGRREAGWPGDGVPACPGLRGPRCAGSGPDQCRRDGLTCAVGSSGAMLKRRSGEADF